MDKTGKIQHLHLAKNNRISYASFNPIICGVKSCYLYVGGAMFSMKGCSETTHFFTQWEMGLLIPRIQKISLLSLKLCI